MLPSSMPQKADNSIVNYWILISAVKLTIDTTETHLFHTNLQVYLVTAIKSVKMYYDHSDSL